MPSEPMLAEDGSGQTQMIGLEDEDVNDGGESFFSFFFTKLQTPWFSREGGKWSTHTHTHTPTPTHARVRTHTHTRARAHAHNNKKRSLPTLTKSIHFHFLFPASCKR